MTSPFPGHSPPRAGFEAPLEMLAACHHRVAQHMAGEEAGLLPMAAGLLSDPAPEGVGRAMRERRGVA